MHDVLALAMGTVYYPHGDPDNRCRTLLASGRCDRPSHLRQDETGSNRERKITQLHVVTTNDRITARVWEASDLTLDGAEVGDQFLPNPYVILNDRSLTCGVTIGEPKAAASVSGWWCRRPLGHRGQHVGMRSVNGQYDVMGVSPSEPPYPSDAEEFRRWIVQELQDEAKRRGWCGEFDQWLAQRGLTQYATPKDRWVTVTATQRIKIENSSATVADIQRATRLVFPTPVSGAEPTDVTVVES